ncbi:MAG TPA: hypothetical protein VMG82_40500 [Candidatus Sulfotelmatobacter sp.]|nr:hypothetical protein [Candidatus Sulfotelmatobacter sp.]
MKVMKTVKLVSTMFLMCAAFAFAQSAHAAVHTDVVLAGGTDSYRSSFQGGQPAQISVRGDGDTFLVLSVYDQNGHLIGSDTCRYNDCSVSWTPLWTGPFTIAIQNLGSVYNDYTVVTV